jgi:hypothetical protein
MHNERCLCIECIPIPIANSPFHDSDPIDDEDTDLDEQNFTAPVIKQEQQDVVAVGKPPEIQAQPPVVKAEVSISKEIQENEGFKEEKVKQERNFHGSERIGDIKRYDISRRKPPPEKLETRHSRARSRSPDFIRERKIRSRSRSRSYYSSDNNDVEYYHDKGRRRRPSLQLATLILCYKCREEAEAASLKMIQDAQKHWYEVLELELDFRFLCGKCSLIRIRRSSEYGTSVTRGMIALMPPKELLDYGETSLSQRCKRVVRYEEEGHLFYLTDVHYPLCLWNDLLETYMQFWKSPAQGKDASKLADKLRKFLKRISLVFNPPPEDWLQWEISLMSSAVIPKKQCPEEERVYKDLEKRWIRSNMIGGLHLSFSLPFVGNSRSQAILCTGGRVWSGGLCDRVRHIAEFIRNKKSTTGGGWLSFCRETETIEQFPGQIVYMRRLKSECPNLIPFYTCENISSYKSHSWDQTQIGEVTEPILDSFVRQWDDLADDPALQQYSLKYIGFFRPLVSLNIPSRFISRSESFRIMQREEESVSSTNPDLLSQVVPEGTTALSCSRCFNFIFFRAYRNSRQSARVWCSKCVQDLDGNNNSGGGQRR